MQTVLQAITCKRRIYHNPELLPRLASFHILQNVVTINDLFLSNLWRYISIVTVEHD